MGKWQMNCTCGDVMSCDAENKDEAVEKMVGEITPESNAQHYAEKHPGQEVPPMEMQKAAFASTARESAEE